MHASSSVANIGAATEFGSEKAKANGANAGAIASSAEKISTTVSDKFRLNRKVDAKTQTESSSKPA
jgi:hypothetical protein